MSSGMEIVLDTNKYKISSIKQDFRTKQMGETNTTVEYWDMDVFVLDQNIGAVSIYVPISTLPVSTES